MVHTDMNITEQPNSTFLELGSCSDNTASCCMGMHIRRVCDLKTSAVTVPIVV